MSSYFWDRATDAGIITDETAITWDLRPADLIKAATKACATPVSGLAAAFPKVCGTPPPPPRLTQPAMPHRMQRSARVRSTLC